MSEQAVELVRRMFDEASRVKDPFARGVDGLDRATLEVIFDFFSPEIEFHEDSSFPESGVYRGLDAVRRYFGQFTENFDEFVFDAEDFIELGEDKVLTLFRLRTRGSGSGATVEARPGWIYTISGGKVVRIETHLDRGEALAAADLRD